jgi:hypothetical protein
VGIALDYTFRIDPAALRAAGVVGVCRYLKPDSAPTYRIGLAEYRELIAAGIDVTLNWEFDAYDWLGGAARGQAHAADAVRQAQALGYRPGRVIVGSADFNMTKAQWDTSAASYARAFASGVRAAGFRPGVYGPWDVLTWIRDDKIMDAFWQAGMSTSWSGGRNAAAWPGAHLRQRGHKTVAGQDCDWNDILIPKWGDDMDQGEKVIGLFNRGNRVGDVFADMSNQRDWWYAPPTGTSNNPPPTGSRADLVVRAAQKLLDTAPATVTDEQAAAMADRIAAVLVAHPDTPLGDADTPAIVSAVKQALREGVAGA